MDTITIREWNDSDSIPELTKLLHRAYKPLADMNLHFMATHQSDEVTLKRISKGTCYLGELDGKVVGAVTFYTPEKMGGTPWYEKEGVAKFGQFAVEPEFQNHGIGSLLMDFVEEETRRRNFSELALDTSELAHHLITYYEKRGYRFIEYVQWKDVNYRSVILSKTV
jgi:GNAT superfamily N-acetyltransferase